MFKVGDKVIVKNTGMKSVSANLLAGKTGIITVANRNFVCLDIETNEGGGLHPFEVELISEPITAQTQLNSYKEYSKLTEESYEIPPNVGVKNDSGKPSISLIPKDAIWGMAQALTFGAKKYGRHNFRNGIAFSRLADAAERHLTAWMEGEIVDSESGLSHLDHALASLAMLKFMDVNRQDMDDRWLNPIHGHNLHPEEKVSLTQMMERIGKYACR